ncbi:hypothetical protein K435DRAFT_962005 [Dendrothele bispora CBS 962.96]|uniref:Zn(2)-C6 fungal-type domain-containing protein n=1 Tax=Dendrothele bispora (strain CBS 962.96) TaxID=1314807 RepID=A0A4S8MP03_DENBC|nr:hypothetical protein K435DRAFT_962005 [Dendrothele bispora CBS 962.96]
MSIPSFAHTRISKYQPSASINYARTVLVATPDFRDECPSPPLFDLPEPEMPIPRSVDGLSGQELQDIEEENEEDMQIYSLKKRKWERAWNNAEQSRRAVLEEREEKKKKWVEKEVQKLQEEKKRKEMEEVKRKEERKRKEQESERERRVQATKRMKVEVVIPIPERSVARTMSKVPTQATTLDSDDYDDADYDDADSESDNNEPDIPTTSKPQPRGVNRPCEQCLRRGTECLQPPLKPRCGRTCIACRKSKRKCSFAIKRVKKGEGQSKTAVESDVEEEDQEEREEDREDREEDREEARKKREEAQKKREEAQKKREKSHKSNSSVQLLEELRGIRQEIKEMRAEVAEARAEKSAKAAAKREETLLAVENVGRRLRKIEEGMAQRPEPERPTVAMLVQPRPSVMISDQRYLQSEGARPSGTKRKGAEGTKEIDLPKKKRKDGNDKEWS